jgi:hypothetical protein
MEGKPTRFKLCKETGLQDSNRFTFKYKRIQLEHTRAVPRLFGKVYSTLERRYGNSTLPNNRKEEVQAWFKVAQLTLIFRF